jgi:hypothetical protein
MKTRLTALAYRTIAFAITVLSIGLMFGGYIPGWDLRSDNILDVVRPGDLLAFLAIGFGCALHQDWNEHKNG